MAEGVRLTKRQRRALEFYRRFKDRPPTGWDLGRHNLGCLALVVAVPVAALVVGAAAGEPGPGICLLSAALGFLVRDSLINRGFVEIWPALAAVLDWDRVDELLATPPGPDEALD